MKPFPEVILGNTDVMQINFGDDLVRDFVWTLSGVPEDITDNIIVIHKASEEWLKTAIQITITDAANGVCTIRLPSEHIDKLPIGKASWFRLKRTDLAGANFGTPEIRIRIS